jgi:hypothetical protein
LTVGVTRMQISVSKRGLNVKSWQVKPMHGISYVTAYEVPLSTGFILYHIRERACTAAEPLRGNLSIGRVGV